MHTPQCRYIDGQHNVEGIPIDRRRSIICAADSAGCVQKLTILRAVNGVTFAELRLDLQHQQKVYMLQRLTSDCITSSATCARSPTQHGDNFKTTRLLTLSITPMFATVLYTLDPCVTNFTEQYSGQDTGKVSAL